MNKIHRSAHEREQPGSTDHERFRADTIDGGHKTFIAITVRYRALSQFAQRVKSPHTAGTAPCGAVPENHRSLNAAGQISSVTHVAASEATGNQNRTLSCT
jgi:hypothetical protein